MEKQFDQQAEIFHMPFAGILTRSFAWRATTPPSRKKRFTNWSRLEAGGRIAIDVYHG
jgi:hypothetical protein